MNKTDVLVEAVRVARDRVLARVQELPSAEAYSRPVEGAWSVAEIVEHLVHAEALGIAGLWKKAERLAAGGSPSHPLTPELAGRSIDEVFADLPENGVDAPDSVLPVAHGWPIGLWIARLRSNHGLLRELAPVLDRAGLEQVVLPHFVAGPLNARQRIEFLRWHLERHERQILRTVVAVRSNSGG